MVKIPSIEPFQFNSDLDRIQDAFQSSIGAMDQTYRHAEAAYQRFIDSGEDDDEFDEDGIIVASTRHDLRWEVMQKSMAKKV